MRTYTVTCPKCGMVNDKIYLDETDGCFECCRCGVVSKASAGEYAPTKVSRRATVRTVRDRFVVVPMLGSIQT